MNVPTLHTDRLTLRIAQMSDFDAYADFRTSARAEFLGGPCSRSAAFDKLGEIVGHWHLRGYGRWIVADKTTDEPLGVVGLFFPDDWPEPEIAWSVFEAGEGKGIAFEAATASRDYAYNTLGWSTAISAITHGNTRSVALAKRMGATFDYVLDHPEIGKMDVYRHPKPEALI